MVETIKGEGSHFPTLHFTGGHDDRTPASSSRLTVLVPRGGRGVSNRNATHRWRTRSCRPVAATSTSNPANPGRRAIETTSTIIAPSFLFGVQDHFSFLREKREMVLAPAPGGARPAHVGQTTTPRSGGQTSPIVGAKIPPLSGKTSGHKRPRRSVYRRPALTPASG